jgi:hypothetical protein
MKNILFITAFVPSNISAGENYSRMLINDIARENNVDLVFFKYKNDKDYVIESKNVTVVKEFRNSVLIKFLNCIQFPIIFPLFSVRFNLFRLFIIKKLLKDKPYDKIIFDFSQTFLFAKFLKKIPVILNSHDVIAQRYSRIYKGFLEPFARISERYVLSIPDAKIFILSSKDRLLFQSLYSIKSEVTNLFIPKEVLVSSPNQLGNYFVFFANWSRPDNSDGLDWFLKRVYPFLENEIKLKIIGDGMPKDLKTRISTTPDIEYLGFLLNPYPIISNSLALISPLFTGAGVKVKVIESLACGTNVIGTFISFEGIFDKYSRYLIKAETAKEFITIINKYKTDLIKKNEIKTFFFNSYSKNIITEFINGNH